MEKLILTDPNQFPTEEVIFSHIGESQKLWLSFFDDIHQNHPDFTEEWRYYKDGYNWLLKVQRKAKTVFWLSVIKDAFQITFYFTDRAEPAIISSAISDALKEQFVAGKHYGKIRGLTILFKDENDLADAKAVIAIKLMIK
jgi:hypothetical protein